MSWIELCAKMQVIGVIAGWVLIIAFIIIAMFID